MKRTCRHCQNRNANRPRGLCWNCFYTDDIRQQYPPCGTHGRVGLGIVPPKKEPIPTTAKPGTPEKLEVFIKRMRRGEWLFHPDDAGDS